MTVNERFKILISYLISSKKIRNQQQFSEETKFNKSTVSQMKNGKAKISPEMLIQIKKVYPFISIDWLINNEGEMLKPNSYYIDDKLNIASDLNTDYTTKDKEDYWRDKYIEILEENRRLYKELSELKRFIL
jgi:transcriptional regulator with XRE-family HTH domain